MAEIFYFASFLSYDSLGNHYKKSPFQTLQHLLERIFVTPINSYCTVGQCLFYITNLKHHLLSFVLHVIMFNVSLKMQ